MRIRVLAIAALCAAAIGGIAVPAAAAESLQDLLAKTQRVANELNYQGTFVYSNMNNKEVVQVTHMADEHGFKERLVSMNGAEQEILQTKDGVWCYFPATKQGYYKAERQQSYRAPAIDPSKVNSFRKHYKIKIHESERMVNRTVTRVTFLPNDQFRYRFDLWIDQETGLVLRSDLIDNKGQMIDSYMFVELQIDESKLSGAATSAIGGTDYVWSFDPQSMMRVPVVDSPWKVQSVPDGFQRIEHVRTYASADAVGYEHMVFSDELSSVSIFIRKDIENRDSYLDGLSRLGAVNAYSRVFGPYNITVIGEVPDPTVRRIADSIAFVQ